MKYIQHSEFRFILWRAKSGMLNHKQMADLILARGGRIVSAGFVMPGNNNELLCFGDSGSLGLGSHENDTLLLKQQMEEM